MIQTRRSIAAIKIQTMYRRHLPKNTYNSKKDAQQLMDVLSPEFLAHLLSTYDSDEDDLQRCPHGISICLGCIDCI